MASNERFIVELRSFYGPDRRRLWGTGAASGGPDSAPRTATSAEADIFVNRNFSPAVQSGRSYQGSVSPRQSRKLPLSPGPAAATTRSMPATDSATGTVAFPPPMSV